MTNRSAVFLGIDCLILDCFTVAVSTRFIKSLEEENQPQDYFSQRIA